MMNINNLRNIALAMCFCFPACTQNEIHECSLIPAPAEISYRSGYYDCSHGLMAVAIDSSLTHAADYLNDVLSRSDMLADGAASIVNLALDPKISSDAYKLRIRKSGIKIDGGDYCGVINGIATLRQMLWENPDSLPFVMISDAPRLKWRGAMLDVARHFFTVGEVKSFIDEMALYKLNKLHIHLTDDQGWRIEIKSLPELVRIGAWRKCNNQDSLCLARAARDKDPKYLLPQDRIRADGQYGGYYTVGEMRDMISYASDRGIEIIPEIDFPGHSLAVLRSYPELSCDGKGGSWGKNFSTPLCLGNDNVMDFCKKVLDGIFDIFPSGYVHVGGDEVERTAWEHCPKCAERVKGNSLGGTDRLQAWFTRELEKYCIEHGRRMIGWDEIAYDGLSRESAVMWWRNWSPESMEKALMDGHDVIVCPSEYYYLTDEQDRNSMVTVYGYEPDPETALTSSLDVHGTSSRGRIIGVQGNLWTEQAPTVERAGERIFPRLLAIAESAWVQPERKDFNAFMRCLPVHLAKLNEFGWKYRMPDVEGICDRNVVAGQANIDLTVPDGASLYYTLDGSVPDTSSSRYSGPFTIMEDCVMKYRCYNSRGVAGDLCEAEFVMADYLPGAKDLDSLSSGLLAKWYDYAGELCMEIDSAPFKGSYVCDGIYIPEGVSGNVGLIFDGYLEVLEDGVYQFYTYTDDGSVLWIDGQETVSNDFGHSRLEKSGQAALRKGLHRITLRYFDHNGGVLQAGMILPDGTHVPFSPQSLFH